MRSCKCPECGGKIVVTNNTLFAICDHCETTVDLSDQRIAKVIETHKIDEAAILMAKVREKELEIEAEKEKRLFTVKAITIVAWIIGVVALACISYATQSLKLSGTAAIVAFIGFAALIPDKRNKP